MKEIEQIENTHGVQQPKPIMHNRPIDVEPAFATTIDTTTSASIGMVWIVVSFFAIVGIAFYMATRCKPEKANKPPKQDAFRMKEFKDEEDAEG